MSNSRYYVVGDKDVWMIQYTDTNDSRLESSSQAALYAVAAAQKLGMRGERAHVCVLDDAGRLQCKWSYGRSLPRTAAPRHVVTQSIRCGRY